MKYVKYVLMKENKNLLRQLVGIIYVKNVLNIYVKVVKVVNAQYVDNMIGFTLNE